MMTDNDFNAATRQRLLALSAALLEGLYEQGAVQVLATLRPADMRPGGARVPGTSYELEAATAARAMRDLLSLRGLYADALVQALAEADIVARYAMLAGQAPPTLASLYQHCTRDMAAPGADSLDAALKALVAAAEKIFTPTQARRIAALGEQVRAQPTRFDAMPVQQFIAGFVRNAP
jgi:hypothetical protein